MKYTVLFLLVVAVYSPSFSQATSSTPDLTAIIQKSGKQFVKNKRITSASIGIYKDGNTYTGHFGSLTKDADNPPSDQTIYEVGSVSKTITGYLAAQAVLEQKISLEDDIRDYLTGDYPNLAYQGSPITVRHLLTHTSGLPTFLPLEMNGVFEQLSAEVPEQYYAMEQCYSKKQFLEDLAKVTLTTTPGNEYKYSNAGAELVGYLLETVYEQSIDDLLQAHFAAPHELSTIAVTLDERQAQHLTQGYWMSSESPAPNNLNTLWGTAGGIKMTLPDLLRYAALQLDQDHPVVAEAQRPLYDVRSPLQIAYYWRVWRDKHGTSYNHHGGTSGMQNWLYLYPKYDLAISIITNQSGPKTPDLLNSTAQKMLKQILKGS